MREFPFQLGFKLPLGWRDAQQRGDLPSLDKTPYAVLTERGFDYVEFGLGSCRSEAERKLLRRESRQCVAAGLGIGLHPYLGGAENCAHYGQRDEARAALLSILRAGQIAAELAAVPAVVVLHPAELNYEETDEVAAVRAELLQRSQAFLRDLEAEAGPGVRPLAEHQVPPGPGERVIRIGDTWDELLRAVEGTDLGLCWDTGHYILSVERHGQSEVPPRGFLERVEAVHLHDVVAGRDHRPVGTGSARVRVYVELLLDVGFGGAITLEYALDGIEDAGGFPAVLSLANETLRAWLT